MTDPTGNNPGAAYWNAKIRRWASSSYAARREDVMARLRSSIDARKVETERLLKTLPAGYTLLDLGCGAGQLAVEAVTECGAARAHGIDFAEDGIRLANELRDAAGLKPGQADFRVGDVLGTWPDGVTVVTGLGLLDWLHPPQIEALFGRLKGKKFVVSFSEQDNSAAEIVHRVYLVWRLRLMGGGVRAYHHRRSWILGLAERNGLGPVEIVSAPAMRFGRLLHNLGTRP